MVTKALNTPPASATRARRLDAVATVVALSMKAAIGPVRADVDRLTRDQATLRASLADLAGRNRQLEDAHREDVACITALQELVRAMDRDLGARRGVADQAPHDRAQHRLH